jgi:hypothetical protein
VLKDLLSLLRIGVLTMGLFSQGAFVPTPPKQYQYDAMTQASFDTPKTLAQACATALSAGEDNKYVSQNHSVACSGGPAAPMHIPNPDGWNDKYAKVVARVVPKGDNAGPVVFQGPAGIAKACAEALACVRNGVTHLPNPNAYKDPYAQIVAHELGHKNGWPSDHPKP